MSSDIPPAGRDGSAASKVQILAAAAGFVLVLGLMGLSGRQAVKTLSPGLEPRFPSPRQEPGE